MLVKKHQVSLNYNFQTICSSKITNIHQQTLIFILRRPGGKKLKELPHDYQTDVRLFLIDNVSSKFVVKIKFAMQASVRALIKSADEDKRQSTICVAF